MTSKLIREPFWYLRHGETDWNAQNLAQGDIDVPLNANGQAQAVAAAKLLPGRGIASIVSSTLGRARDTAIVAAEALGLPVAFDSCLREVNFGVRERSAMGDPWFADWVEGRATPEGGEAFAALRARAVRAVNAALERPALVLVVAHGGLFRALRAEMELPPNLRTANAQPILCQPPTDGQEVWTLLPAVPGSTPI